MIRALELQDFAIVDALRLELDKGFNVLSGETGAGKSILIDALALLLGGKADPNVIRSGSEEALVQAEFQLMFPHLPQINSLSRRLKTSGRPAARVDGEIVKLSELSDIGQTLISIYGQHAAQTLMSASEQRKCLDNALDAKGFKLLQSYKEGYQSCQSLQKELAHLQQSSRERAQRLDMINFQLEEIRLAKLKPGEDLKLKERAESLRYAERITQASGQALELLSESDKSAISQIAEAVRQLENAARYQKELETLAQEIENAMHSLEASSEALASFLQDFEIVPGELEQLERRLSKIDKLKAKYGEDIEAILDYAESIEKEQLNLDGADDKIAHLQEEVFRQEQKLEGLARELSQARTKLAQELSLKVSQELRPLGMKHARFEILVSSLDSFGPHGKDQIQFLFSANLGEALGPLNAIASGGELSRVMLALNVVTASDAPSLAFDEVDAGIGGQTALAVGRLLQRLAENKQILVVTHLAQVAAYANSHFYVEKLEQEGRTFTRIRKLNHREREHELARMLSGYVTESSLAHARELLTESLVVLSES
ncbi:MAG: DNA repair protein RecN [Deinococcales bacterium]